MGCVVRVRVLRVRVRNNNTLGVSSSGYLLEQNSTFGVTESYGGAVCKY